MVEGIGGQSFQLQLPQELKGMPNAPGMSGPVQAAGGDTSVPTESFGTTLKHFLGEVNGMQLHSDQMIQSFVRGEVTDLHQVVLAQQEASISLRLVGQMRDQLISAYQEVMRITM